MFLLARTVFSYKPDTQSFSSAFQCLIRKCKQTTENCQTSEESYWDARWGSGERTTSYGTTQGQLLPAAEFFCFGLFRTERSTLWTQRLCTPTIFLLNVQGQGAQFHQTLNNKDSSTHGLAHWHPSEGPHKYPENLNWTYSKICSQESLGGYGKLLSQYRFTIYISACGSIFMIFWSCANKWQHKTQDNTCIYIFFKVHIYA